MSLLSRRLPWQQPLQLKGSERYVYSQDELISAISDYASSSTNVANGRILKFGGPIIINKTIDLSQCSRLIIDGNGQSLQNSGVSGLTAFQWSGPLITIRNMIVSSGAFGPSFGTCIAFGQSCSESVIDNCLLAGNNTLISGSSSSSAIRITNNILSGSGATSVLMSQASSLFIQSNYFSGTNVTVNLGANSNHCSIMGNICTSATGAFSNLSAGNNVWVGNVNFGLITNAGSDTLSANT